jgi:antitoxin component of MazEF toxin-antitoxin module
MFEARIRKVGDSYVVTVPRAEMELQQLAEGDVVSVEVRRMEVRPALNPEVRQILDEHWAEDEPAYRHLGR